MTPAYRSSDSGGVSSGRPGPSPSSRAFLEFGNGDFARTGQISNISDHIWTFGSEKEKVSGTVDRTTGSTLLTFHEIARVLADIGFERPFVTFSGMCRKAGKLF
jgi:hypothetical protein